MRKLSQREVLRMVLATWREHEPGPKIDRGVRATAWFLFFLVIFVAVFALLVRLMQAEEHGQHRARASGQIEGPQRVHLQAAREVGDVVHTRDCAPDMAVSA